MTFLTYSFACKFSQFLTTLAIILHITITDLENDHFVFYNEICCNIFYIPAKYPYETSDAGDLLELKLKGHKFNIFSEHMKSTWAISIFTILYIFLVNGVTETAEIDW